MKECQLKEEEKIKCFVEIPIVDKLVIYLIHFFVSIFKIKPPDPLTSQYLPHHCGPWNTNVKSVKRPSQLQVN